MNWPPIMTALLTPYDSGGAVDPEKAAALARHLVGQGCGGFVVAGSTGEAYGLSLEERRALFYAVKAAVPAEVAVWVGTGHNDTRETVRLTEAAEAWGADGMLIVAPYYNKPSQEGLAAHFVEAARHTSRPVMLYDVPGRTGVRVDAETVLAAHRKADNIVAVKEAAGSVAAMIAMHRALGSEIRLYSGDDGLLLPSLAVGAVGVVSVAAHVAAAPMASLVAHYHAGQRHQAIQLHEKLWPLAQELFCDANPVPLKWLMNRLGWQVGGVRAPLTMPRDIKKFDGLWQAYQQLAELESARSGAS
ncbi:4-hydroxy-tetrahydrodipicolinate synthase [Sulfobacillus harzensis]|uniref:4-hydroxy-tetrahydrodipicolinate synthase n=1 Tax=Sulfobacillus harzensis TaxID=2729629 RepID=A0A7Y0L272_9FIRM|nr:4-hydroxy-tetrahydrodipicolinate synthase [Sulfobacillus harzensis]NMP21850.1 4-hydroxy-tetrahydrodipicolinate synthase [Sulfobacillus harzensis]